ncbi:MAG: 50S ribosomal protein L30 [Flavobacteriales bacterium AspAUS03]
MIRLKQIRSAIDCSKVQKSTLCALGLKKINQEVRHKISPQILGMISRVAHLLKINKI